MNNKPLLWVLGGGAFAFVAVIAYWIFAITLSSQLRSDQVSPQRTAAFIHAILEANRNNYTDNVVVKLRRDGVEAHEHWRDERGVPLPAQFLLETGRLVALKDLNFSFRLQQLTSIKTDPDGKIVELTDKELFGYPWIYVVEPGDMVLTDEEAAALPKKSYFEFHMVFQNADGTTPNDEQVEKAKVIAKKLEKE